MPPDAGSEWAPAQLWTARLAAAADRHVMDTLGIPSPVLMERAALAVASQVQAWLAGARAPVLSLCGPGNNGGDGLAVARILRGRGVDARAVVVCDRANDVVAQQLALARACGVPVSSDLAELDGLAAHAVVVDGLLGTGSRGAPRGVVADAITRTQGQRRPVIAIDLPSGVDPDRGAVAGAAIEAVLTVTFQCSKPGLHVVPGRDHAGRIVVADIGLVAAPAGGEASRLIAPDHVAAALAGLAPARHKNDRGHVGLLAGSPGTGGAAVLAGSAAMRAGAGLVTIACEDAQLQRDLLATRPELMSASPDADPVLPRAQALTVGPGLTCASARARLGQLWRDDPRPAIWDASALDELPADVEGAVAGPRVITPHPGEAARLLSRLTTQAWDSERVQSDRIGAVHALAARTHAVAVLKGEGTLVAAPAGTLAVCVSGGRALATAGTGDVLAGLIGTLLARGLPAWEAACIGVHVHGMAGDLAGERHPGTMAMDVVDALPDAMRDAVDGRVPATWPRLYRG